MSIDDKYEGIEEKYDGVRELMNLGKEKGYLLYDEVNDILPDDIHSSKDLDNIFYLFGDAGIEVIDSKQQLEVVKQKIHPKTDEDEERDLTAQSLEKTNDPVRMYLREMGTVPLLTREGEVEIAKRIEKGQRTVIKALSRSPVVVAEILK
ncbi:RNA polymerase sigma factor RpoD, partial [Acidobacteria bacterium AH-259-G07]|nr:RNA polymerase sigma factor RpoD [Acidobacteria bacterium AH-259-G07]